MTLIKVDEVTKLNKGTSRDQWGTLSHWGYKTADGRVRARLFDDGILELKHFDPAMRTNHWRSTIYWNEAPLIATSRITLTDKQKDKGPLGKDMIDYINDLIEIHNEAFDEYVGGEDGTSKKKYQVQQYDESWSVQPQEIKGVSIEFDADNETTNTLVYLDSNRYGHVMGTGWGLDQIREFSDDQFIENLDKCIAEAEGNIAKSQQFILDIREAQANGTTLEDVDYYSDRPGPSFDRPAVSVVLAALEAMSEAKTEEPVTA